MLTKAIVSAEGTKIQIKVQNYVHILLVCHVSALSAIWVSRIGRNLQVISGGIIPHFVLELNLIVQLYSERGFRPDII